MLTHRSNIVSNGILLLTLFILAVLGKLSFVWLIIPIACHLFLTIWGSFSIQSNYHLKSFSSGIKNGVSLTFDDGPSDCTLAVLDLLKKYDAKATFFCIGRQLEKYPEIAQKIVSEGHLIANHTMRHLPEMGFKDQVFVLDEILKTNEQIFKTTGLKSRWFRPPFGVTNPSISKAIDLADMKCIGWNVRSLDTTTNDANWILKRIQRKLKPNSILLLHDTRLSTVEALEQLLIYLRENEIPIIALDEMINEKPYEI